MAELKVGTRPADFFGSPLHDQTENKVLELKDSRAVAFILVYFYFYPKATPPPPCLHPPQFNEARFCRDIPVADTRRHAVLRDQPEAGQSQAKFFGTRSTDWLFPPSCPMRNQRPWPGP